jgi:hypothetical protein
MRASKAGCHGGEVLVQGVGRGAGYWVLSPWVWSAPPAAVMAQDNRVDQSPDLVELTSGKFDAANQYF